MNYSKVRREKLPGNIKAKDLLKTFREVGVGGKRLPEKELREVIQGTRFDRKFSHSHHLSPKDVEEVSKLIIQKHGHSKFDVQKLEKKFQTEQQSPRPVKKSSGEGFLSGLLGRKKATPSGGAYRLSEKRMAGSLTSQPPAQPPTTTQKPNLQPIKRTPKMKV